MPHKLFLFITNYKRDDDSLLVRVADKKMIQYSDFIILIFIIKNPHKEAINVENDDQ